MKQDSVGITEGLYCWTQTVDVFMQLSRWFVMLPPKQPTNSHVNLAANMSPVRTVIMDFRRNRHILEGCGHNWLCGSVGGRGVRLGWEIWRQCSCFIKWVRLCEIYHISPNCLFRNRESAKIIRNFIGTTFIWCVVCSCDCQFISIYIT